MRRCFARWKNTTTADSLFQIGYGRLQACDWNTRIAFSPWQYQHLLNIHTSHSEGGGGTVQGRTGRKCMSIQLDKSTYLWHILRTSIQQKGKYQNWHLFLRCSFWFYLILFLVLFSSVFGSLVIFHFFLFFPQVLSWLDRSENQSLVILVIIL